MKNKKQIKNESKDIVISTRLTSAEYTKMQLKITDASGHSIMKPSAYLRAAVLGVSVNLVDAEVERYKAYVAGKLGNNINQIAKRLHQHHNNRSISDATYQDVLEEFQKLNNELAILLAPIRG
ncbi:MAG: hypothetical protein methR_P0588 [Methyloprofundus sp.]|nr:MAG: hypothetical protein methR_P0588 [Methyloprofundus sp.]